MNTDQSEKLLFLLDAIARDLNRIAVALSPNATDSPEHMTLADHIQILTNTVQDLTDNVLPDNVLSRSERMK